MTALLTADEAARLVPGERLVIVRAGDCTVCEWIGHEPVTGDPCVYVAPQDWVALTGPCPTCSGVGTIPAIADQVFERWICRDPDCRDGRRIVPLYREGDQPERKRKVMVGRGSIEVVPVVTADGIHDLPMPCVEVFKVIDDDPANDNAIVILWWQERGQEMVSNRVLSLDPLPVPGRDFGIVIDCVEVAS